MIRILELRVVKNAKLSKSMTLEQFDNGYWYAEDLKNFAKDIGVPKARTLRKDQLEKIIKIFLKTGNIQSKTKKKTLSTKKKDLENGLSFNLPVINYTSNKETKDFLLKEALKINPNLPQKSGCKYWLNRWREEQIEKGKKITYGDLVKKYVSLRETKKDFPQIPSTKFNNFIADYLSNKEGSKKQALAEWEKLKKLKIPKTYKSWKKYQN